MRFVNSYRVSIHSSHTGGDMSEEQKTAGQQEFQSTPPIREETQKGLRHSS